MTEDDVPIAPFLLMINATVHYLTEDGHPAPVETVLLSTPHEGMRLEFYDGDIGVELEGIVTQVVSRDLDGDLSLHVYTRRP